MQEEPSISAMIPAARNSTSVLSLVHRLIAMLRGKVRLSGSMKNLAELVKWADHIDGASIQRAGGRRNGVFIPAMPMTRLSNSAKGTPRSPSDHSLDALYFSARSVNNHAEAGNAQLYITLLRSTSAPLTSLVITQKARMAYLLRFNRVD